MCTKSRGHNNVNSVYTKKPASQNEEAYGYFKGVSIKPSTRSLITFIMLQYIQVYTFFCTLHSLIQSIKRLLIPK